VAIAKLKEAWDAYRMWAPTTDPGFGALMALREAITITIGELKRRMPKQVETGRRGKIIEIGKQLGLASVLPETFEDMEEQHRKIQDSLSWAKDNVASRTKQTALMNMGTMFLFGLLEAIDRNKIRK
jgi:hypothetical protein